MWFVRRTHISMTIDVVSEKKTHVITLVDPDVVSEKNTHRVTLVDPYLVCEKNTPAMTLGVVHEKNTHPMNSSGSICGL